jgi:hypothetical protein
MWPGIWSWGDGDRLFDLARELWRPSMSSTIPSETMDGIRWIKLPMKYHILQAWTYMNNSYFGVNRKVSGFWPIAIIALLSAPDPMRFRMALLSTGARVPQRSSTKISEVPAQNQQLQEEKMPLKELVWRWVVCVFSVFSGFLLILMTLKQSGGVIPCIIACTIY